MTTAPASLPEFHDDYDHPDVRIEYILENTLMPPPPSAGSPNSDTELNSYTHLADLYNTRFTAGCKCAPAQCTAAAECACLRGAANYIASHEDCSGSVLHLNPQRASADLLYECGTQCNCGPNCGNRLVQYGPHRNLRIGRTAAYQWGVINAGPRPLAAGTFVCEYAGELLTGDEARRRHDGDYAALGVNYVMCLNERAAAQPPDGCNIAERAPTQTFIDPTRRGNVGRYLNHSCAPNCEILSVRVDGPIPRLGIFTCTPVDAGAELCFDYSGGAAIDERQRSAVNETSNAPRTRCLCGTSHCRGYLPSLGYE